MEQVRNDASKAAARERRAEQGPAARSILSQRWLPTDPTRALDSSPSTLMHMSLPQPSTSPPGGPAVVEPAGVTLAVAPPVASAAASSLPVASAAMSALGGVPLNAAAGLSPLELQAYAAAAYAMHYQGHSSIAEFHAAGGKRPSKATGAPRGRKSQQCAQQQRIVCCMIHHAPAPLTCVLFLAASWCVQRRRTV